MDERRAIESGHVYEGQVRRQQTRQAHSAADLAHTRSSPLLCLFSSSQRLKDPEFYRSTFLRTPTEEYESERRWAQRRASLGYDDTEHITRAGAAVTPRGGVASVLGKVTHALGIPVQTTTTKYPLCLRSIVHPRSARRSVQTHREQRQRRAALTPFVRSCACFARKDTHDSKIEGDIILVQVR